ncbi:MAG: VOC family protein [Rhodobacteraceae bacterium]|nr:VOC family protein [Paracoccaceae bacterium]
MEQRLTMVTLGVADLKRARRFYMKLGFKAAPGPGGDVEFYQLNGIALGLFGTKDLATDANIKSSRNGYGNITLAHNVRKASDVKKVLAEAKRAGAKILRPASKAFWGGTTGYFADPDGHVWEVAHNPFWKLDAKGNVKL